MYKQTSFKKTEKGINIRIGHPAIPFQSVTVYQHCQDTKPFSKTEEECYDLVAEVIEKLNEPVPPPAEIDITEPTFGRGFTIGAVVGGVVTFIGTALIYLFCNHFSA